MLVSGFERIRLVDRLAHWNDAGATLMAMKGQLPDSEQDGVVNVYNIAVELLVWLGQKGARYAAVVFRSSFK